LARKILLADDSVTAQNMGRKILTEAGYEVITVNNGSAALKKINELKPDLIVLDVYMPGYGGLEVCHRLKENPETARIPVLLTVGKLEPFKVEEARRVRADMHIVKPFESNELLTALAKLEDRIVAQSDAPKKGRFSKTGLAEPAPADTFGDEQSGWKSRLIAPKKKSKTEKAEKIEPKPEPKREREYTTEEGAEAETVSATDWRSMLSASLAADANTEDEPQPLAKTETKNKAKTTQEVKEEETQEEVRQETKPETDSLAAEVLRNAQAAAAAEIAQPEVQAPIAETKNAEKIKAEEIREEEKIQEKEARDQDVADALATLVPAPSSADERELVGVAASHQSVGASGPRWTAQAIPVNEEESQSLLEQEMERAYAQLTAAAEATPAVSFAMGPLDAMSFSSASDEPVSREQQYRERRRAEERATESKNAFSEAPATQSEVVEEVAKVEESAPVSETKMEAVAQETDSPADAATVDEKAEAPAETKPEETKEAAKEEVKEEPVQERRVSSAASLWMSAPAAYVAATTESKTEPQAESAKAEAPATQEAVNQDAVAPQAAFAAAAGAEVTSANTAEAPAEPAQSPSAKKESELAAAWQSWRQIREVDGKSSAAASEPEKPAKFKDVANWRDEIEPAAKAESKDKDEEESHGEEISSLVDTMLAELKPKLMKEIAKKMGKDKDGKR